MKRMTKRVPGWDCIRHPCGKNGCGERPGASHGIHCEDWLYVVSDGDVALSLTVFSNVYPDSVPEDDRLPKAPWGADLSLHVGFPLPTFTAGDDDECPWLDGGRCYQGGHYSSALQGGEFWEEHAGRDHGFTQPESFWMALEERLVGRAGEVREEAANQVGGGI